MKPNRLLPTLSYGRTMNRRQRGSYSNLRKPPSNFSIIFQVSIVSMTISYGYRGCTSYHGGHTSYHLRCTAITADIPPSRTQKKNKCRINCNFRPNSNANYSKFLPEFCICWGVNFRPEFLIFRFAFIHLLRGQIQARIPHLLPNTSAATALPHQSLQAKDHEELLRETPGPIVEVG